MLLAYLSSSLPMLRGSFGRNNNPARLTKLVLPVLLPILVSTYCAAISFRPSRTLSFSFPCYRYYIDRLSLRIFLPSLKDLLIAHWALFWRLPIQATLWVIGWGLEDLLGGAGDLWLSAEL
ncbi:hypothetical protein GGS26DRAFT_557561 [Hypomontagnella submonticulosa]|nr:hypothetical protein GGS26DRAFT_557561 [Hypomontagnella submonticulosa]